MNRCGDIDLLHFFELFVSPVEERLDGLLHLQAVMLHLSGLLQHSAMFLRDSETLLHHLGGTVDFAPDEFQTEQSEDSFVRGALPPDKDFSFAADFHGERFLTLWHIFFLSQARGGLRARVF